MFIPLSLRRMHLLLMIVSPDGGSDGLHEWDEFSSGCLVSIIGCPETRTSDRARAPAGGPYDRYRFRSIPIYDPTVATEYRINHLFISFCTLPLCVALYPIRSALSSY